MSALADGVRRVRPLPVAALLNGLKAAILVVVVPRRCAAEPLTLTKLGATSAVVPDVDEGSAVPTHYIVETHPAAGFATCIKQKSRRTPHQNRHQKSWRNLHQTEIVAHNKNRGAQQNRHQKSWRTPKWSPKIVPKAVAPSPSSAASAAAAAAAGAGITSFFEKDNEKNIKKTVLV